MAFHEEEEISEHQENDQDQFSDQLISVVMLRRITAEHCVPLLTRCTYSTETSKANIYLQFSGEYLKC